MAAPEWPLQPGGDAGPFPLVPGAETFRKTGNIKVGPIYIVNITLNCQTPD